MSSGNQGYAMENGKVGQNRKHAQVLRCYLGGFARQRNGKAELYVVDSVVGRAFVTTPRMVAAGRGFNR